MSSIGRIFRVTTYGESHCRGVGAVVDGVPPGLELTELDIQPQLTRRRPGQSKLTTPRDEKDQVQILSGTERGLTLGTPIGLFVPNENIRPVDYSEMAAIPRPGHAEYTYQQKYGIRASSGGGRSSARETIGRVAAGAIAEKVLNQTYPDLEIVAYVSRVGTVPFKENHGTAAESPIKYTRAQVDLQLQLLVDPKESQPSDDRNIEADFVTRLERGMDDADNRSLPAYRELATGRIYSAWGHECPRDAITCEWHTQDIVTVRCPDPSTASAMASLIRQVKAAQDSVGGIVTCVVRNMPVGLGEPCFDKLEASLAHAMLSLPATKGFDIGSGFAGSQMFGSAHNDCFVAHPTDDTKLATTSNFAGGTLGGISNGSDLVFRVAIKPVSTIGRAQETVDFNGLPVTLEAKGRHDPCVLPRAVPLVEAMTALVLADAMLIQKTRSCP